MAIPLRRCLLRGVVVMRRMMALLAVGGMVLLELVSTGGPARALVPGTNGRIVFTRFHCRQVTGSEGIPVGFLQPCKSQEIVAADPNDANETVLATFSSDTILGFRGANWSPDGKTVIFAVNTAGSGPCGISTVNADGTGLRPIVQAPPGTCFGEGPSFTPDGRHIVAELCCVPGYGDSLWIMNSDGTGLQALTSEPEGVADEVPQVSPDGTRIALGQCSDTGCRLAAVPIAGGTPHVLFDQPLPGLGSPNWSPDSNKLVIQAGFNGCTSDIGTINPDGTGFTRLTFNTCKVGIFHGSFNPTYSPDGTKILFAQSLDTARVDVALVDLFTMNRDGTGITHVTRTATPEFLPQWAVATS
jgi:Tol biopolymer transport system component